MAPTDGRQKKWSEVMGSRRTQLAEIGRTQLAEIGTSRLAEIGRDCEHQCMTHRDIPDSVRKNIVATTATWRAQGVSKLQMRSLERAGHLVRMRRGVYASRNAVRWAEGD